MKKKDPIEGYEKKVLRTIEKYKLIRAGDRVLLALSGGKDSAAAGYLTVKYVREKNLPVDIKVFHINFDIEGLSEKVEEVIRKQAEIFDVPVIIYHVSEMGIDMKRVARLKRPICSSCGVIKRYLMNRIPRELGFNKIVTGHHADDFLTFFFKNVMGENFSWISKFLPLLPGDDKRVARLRPLFFVGGEENRQFCESKGIPYSIEDLCPHVYVSCRIDPTREMWYKFINDISQWRPDFRERMMRGVAKLAVKLPQSDGQLRTCKVCGEPTSTEICAFCRLVKAQEEIEIEPKGK